MQTRWYGQSSLAVDSAAFWQVGSFQLWVHRSAREWKMASLPGGDALEHSLVAEVPSDRPGPPPGSTVRRFGFRMTPENIELKPVLADRPVVVNPEEPFHILPKEQITVFISTPIWIEIMVGSSPLSLLDEPTHRPTDTWFGPSSLKGELCYATRTAARMNLDNVPSRPHRAISVVEIRNNAKTTLTIEKLRIPVVHQSVYAAENGNLWTDTVTLDHQNEGSLATIRLGKGPPKVAANAELVRGPRTPMEPGLLTRAFGGLTR